MVVCFDAQKTLDEQVQRNNIEIRAVQDSKECQSLYDPQANFLINFQNPSQYLHAHERQWTRIGNGELNDSFKKEVKLMANKLSQILTCFHAFAMRFGSQTWDFKHVRTDWGKHNDKDITVEGYHVEKRVWIDQLVTPLSNYAHAALDCLNGECSFKNDIAWLLAQHLPHEGRALPMQWSLGPGCVRYKHLVTYENCLWYFQRLEESLVKICRYSGNKQCWWYRFNHDINHIWFLRCFLEALLKT